MKRQKNCTLSALSARIFLACQFKKRAKQHAYPQAIRPSRAHRNNLSHNTIKNIDLSLFNTSECVRASRQIAITAIVDSNKNLGTSNKIPTDRSLRFLGGAGYTSPSDRYPFAYMCSDWPGQINCLLILGNSHWTDRIETLPPTEVLIGQFDLIV